jgi:hypothetical protein
MPSVRHTRNTREGHIHNRQFVALRDSPDFRLDFIERRICNVGDRCSIRAQTSSTQRAELGDRRAQRALALAEHPTRFLSTVQVGIPLIGVFAGAYDGASLAGQLEAIRGR